MRHMKFPWDLLTTCSTIEIHTHVYIYVVKHCSHTQNATMRIKQQLNEGLTKKVFFLSSGLFKAVTTRATAAASATVIVV